MSSVPPIHQVASPENAKSIAPSVAFWCGLKVPEGLLSGHHAEIEKWRSEQAEERTRKRRPELLKGENKEE